MNGDITLEALRRCQRASKVPTYNNMAVGVVIHQTFNTPQLINKIVSSSLAILIWHVYTHTTINFH